MNSFPVISLNDNTFFTQDLVLDKNFILLNPTCPFKESLKKALLDWDFKVVYSNGSQGIGVSATPDTTDFEQITIEDVGKSDAERGIQSEMTSNVKKVIEEAHSNLQNNDKSRMNVVETVYNEYMNYITAVYTHYATHKVLNYEELTETVKELCIFIKDNRRYVLRITPTQEQISKNYLISHSMRSSVIAIVIGLQLHIPFSKLIDLGITCMLHEIGQIRLPPQLYMTDRKLSPQERAKLSTHAFLGFEILKQNNFPSAILLGVLEHHERENGTGYPQKLMGNKISQFSKIIAVACSFEAITSPRHFKQARTTYDAMVEILKNEGKQFDDTVIKALLFSLSLYPIGAYVYLANGKIGQVTDVNPNSPGNPMVSILGMTDANGGPVTIQTDNGSNKIVRVLNKQECADILKQFTVTK